MKGVWVSIEDTIKGFNTIMDGAVDQCLKQPSTWWEPLKMPLKKGGSWLNPNKFFVLFHNI